MLYYNDWCSIESGDGVFNIVVKTNIDDIIRIDNTPLDDIKLQATLRASSVLGSNPVICLSGGIDSQAMYHIWHKDIPVTVAVFEFEHGQNSEEVKDAQRFADKFQIPIKKIKLDVMKFLHFDLINYGKKYHCCSPQFAVHCFFLNTLKEQGYTGAAFGGNGPVIDFSGVYFSQTKAQLFDLENFNQPGFTVIPTFLAFDQDLCLKLSLATPLMENVQDINLRLRHRYSNKISSYKNLGLDVVPQIEKKTGFEQLKNIINGSMSDVWGFERKFRGPLLQMNMDCHSVTIIDNQVRDYIFNRSKSISFDLSLPG